MEVAVGSEVLTVLMTSIGEHNNISGTFSKPMCCRGRQLRQDAARGEGMQRYAATASLTCSYQDEDKKIRTPMTCLNEHCHGC